jgi:fumarate reductase flavoprotein subunit
MGSFQGHSALCFPHMIHLGWPAFSQGGFQVNSDGRRFSNETEGVSEQALKVLRQPGAVAWAVWDARCDAVADQMHNHLEAKKAGAVRSFADLSDAAGFVGCDPDQLIETVRSVERFARGEQRCPWGRDFTRFPPLRPPYLMAKITGALFHTQGGLEVDLEARVRRQDGSQFPNLLAGGGAARGLVGPADWGYLPGAGLLSAINLGRIAGESAAALVAGCPGPRP